MTIGCNFIQLENTVLIFSEKSSPRLKYILNLIFKDVYGLNYEITQDIEAFKASTDPKINYSHKDGSGGIRILPFSLLFEYGIKDHHIEINGHPAYFKYFFKNNGEVPFDIFSASFWLLSRYEEYLPFKPDRYNRFEVKNSLAWQNNFIEIPLVNLWLEEFKKKLMNQFPQLNFRSRHFNYISSIDIDNAYKFSHKGLMRTLGGYAKSIVTNNRSEFKERTTVLLHRKNDPFDSYDFLLATQKKYELETLYFFLLGDYGVNDKNHPSNNKDFRSLIQHLADYSGTGIHPSYRSTANLNQLKVEINRLSNITHKDVKNSRQHFGILTFPATYQALLQAGLTHDHSMGYGNCNGFRASFCWPYNWYDLDSEQETPLIIHPFCIIETSIKYNNNATAENAVSFVTPIINEVKKYNGELVSIFHNDTLGEEPEWKGWQKVYTDLIEEILKPNP